MTRPIDVESYEKGLSNGESSRDFDWWLALDLADLPPDAPIDEGPVVFAQWLDQVFFDRRVLVRQWGAAYGDDDSGFFAPWRLVGPWNPATRIPEMP